jgi:hypothetical protein
MRQIVYFSTASERQDISDVAAILAVSRIANFRDGITGLLVAGGNRYLQVIEGPPPAIAGLLRRLRADQRHLAMTVLVDRRLKVPQFEGWSMACVEAAAVPEFATLRDLADTMRESVADPDLQDQIDCFVQSFAIFPPPVWPALAVDGGH